MTAKNTVIAHSGVFPGAGATYVASDGSQKAATILAVAGTQSIAVPNSEDGTTVAPADAGNVHVRVLSLSGKAYNRYNVPVAN